MLFRILLNRDLLKFSIVKVYWVNMSDSQSANSYVLKLVRRHQHDWMILIFLGLVDGLLNLIEPFHRYLSEEMLTPDIKYPYHHDTIPMWSVPVCYSS